MEDPAAVVITIALLLRMIVKRMWARGNFSIALDTNCLTTLPARRIWRHDLKKEEPHYEL